MVRYEICPSAYIKTSGFHNVSVVYDRFLWPLLSSRYCWSLFGSVPRRIILLLGVHVWMEFGESSGRADQRSSDSDAVELVSVQKDNKLSRLSQPRRNEKEQHGRDERAWLADLPDLGVRHGLLEQMHAALNRHHPSDLAHLSGTACERLYTVSGVSHACFALLRGH